MTPVSVTIWRCSTCGHWSHAQRRPTSHPRFLRNFVDEFDELLDLPEGRGYHYAETEAADLELPVVYVAEPYSAQVAVDDWEFNPGGVKVKCGPFVEFRAELVAPWFKDPTAKRHAARLSAEAADDSRYIEVRRREIPSLQDDAGLPF